MRWKKGLLLASCSWAKGENGAILMEDRKNPVSHTHKSPPGVATVGPRQRVHLDIGR